MKDINDAIDYATWSFSNFAKTYFRLKRSLKRWRMTEPTGKTRKEKMRDQTKLKGRRKRVRTGLTPRRGKGRTTHGRR